MMAYNNYFPVGYQQFYPQFQQFQQPQPTQSQPQMMTPPTIRAEIVQVNNKQEAANFPVGAGQAQMMIAKDESAIYIKTAFANGQANLDEYIKKPPEPEKSSVDYVTREEFEQRLSALQRRVNNEQSVSVPRTGTATTESNADASTSKI